MVYPPLVPDAVCTTPIRIYLEDGFGEDGSPHRTVLFSGRCNYRRVLVTKLQGEHRTVTVTGEAYLTGDVLQGQELSGVAQVGEDTTPRPIVRAERAYNPDGTVNYTRLELMG